MLDTHQTRSPLDWALAYVARGWPVLPLYPIIDGECACSPRQKRDRKCAPGKHPYVQLTHGVRDATLDADRVRLWWGPLMWPDANIGIDLAGAGLLDVAPDNVADLAEFIARGLPETLTFRSGSGEGHQHFLYKLPEGAPRARLCLSGRYDLMSDGYAVVPPSVTHGPYEWLKYLPDAPPTAPPMWAVELLILQVELRTPATELSVPGDAVIGEGGEPPLDIDRRVWTGEGLVDGKRSGALWAIGGELAQAGANEATIVEALRERDETLGLQKYSGRSDRERRYLEIARRQLAAVMPRIHLNGHTPAPKAEPPQLEWLTAAQIADMEDEHIAWYAYGLVGQGLISELDGKVKQSGKSTLVLAMCGAILDGEPFLGQDTIYSPICYLTEQSGPSFKRNLRRAGLLGRSDLHILLWNKAVGVKWDAVVVQATAHAVSVGAKILIVDTLGQFSGIRGDNENSAGAAMVVMEPLQVAAASGLAILVARHDRKSGGEVGDSGRGSSAYAGAVDIVLHLQRLEGDHTGKERQRLLEGISRFEETPEKLLIELGAGEPHVFSALGDATVVRDQMMRRELLANLPTNPDDAIDRKALGEAVGGKDEDRWRVLNDLQKEGLVKRIGLGKRGDPYCYYQRAWNDDE